MISHYVYGLGGTIYLDIPRTATTVTCEVEDNNGTVVSSGAATVSTIDTALAVAASAGDTSITVSSATGIASGSKLILASPIEACLVKSVSGTTVHLMSPLGHSHAISTDVNGYVISYTIDAADADTMFYNGRAIWTVDDEKVVTAVDCTKWPLVCTASENDIIKADPDFKRFISAHEHVFTSLEGAWGAVLREIGGRGRVHTMTASQEFSDVVALRYLKDMYARYRPDTDAQYETYSEFYQEAISSVMSYLPRDVDGDDVASEEEKLRYNNVSVGRA